MSILKVAKLGNPILRRVANPVTVEESRDPGFALFLEEMVETMRKLDGVGLAAPQVFHSKQVIVIESLENLRDPDSPSLPLLIVLNPMITHYSEETQEGWEGCLSLDNLRGRVVRSAFIHLDGFNPAMEPISFDAEGFLAVVFQHEVDHLNGKVFIDRMTDLTTLTHLEEYDRYWMNRPEKVGVS
jgi:peptide deformylase